jgi:hypothetical protein
MRHDSGLIAQHGLHLARIASRCRGLATNLQTCLVLVLFSGPEGQISVFKWVVLLLVWQDGIGCVPFVNVRIDELWECTLADQVIVTSSSSSTLLFVRLRGILLLFLLVVRSTIVALLARGVAIVGRLVRRISLIFDARRLLVKYRVIDGLGRSTWRYTTAMGVIIYVPEQSLTIILLESRIVHQDLLLLRKITSLTFEISSNESSGAPWYFHEVLGQFLAIGFLVVGSGRLSRSILER